MEVNGKLHTLAASPLGQQSLVLME